MRRFLLFVILTALLSSSAAAQSSDTPVDTNPVGFWQGVKSAIQSHLGRPYVWGASGIKSFDCSGFVWRVMYENGILLKRTTARKFFMILPKATKDDQANFGTLVFFDDLKHIGIVDDATSFYHAQVTLGTNRSPMNSFWRNKIYGFRKLPAPER